jgi:hypothetical protein
VHSQLRPRGRIAILLLRISSVPPFLIFTTCAPAREFPSSQSENEASGPFSGRSIFIFVFFATLKLARCPRSLAPTLVALPRSSRSLHSVEIVSCFPAFLSDPSLRSP